MLLYLNDDIPKILKIQMTNAFDQILLLRSYTVFFNTVKKYYVICMEISLTYYVIYTM